MFGLQRCERRLVGGWAGAMEPLLFRKLNGWELEGVEASFRFLHMISIRSNGEDWMRWKEAKCGIFSVKSLYASLAREPFLANIVILGGQQKSVLGSRLGKDSNN